MTVPEAEERGGVEVVGEGEVEGLGGRVAGEEGVTGLHGFGAIGDEAGDDAGDAEKGGFFLNATGIGEDSETGGEECREGIGWQGREAVDVGVELYVMAGLLDGGVGVDGPEEVDLGVGDRGVGESGEDAAEGETERLAAVEGDEDAGVAGAAGVVGEAVKAGIAHEENLVGGNPFNSKDGRIGWGWGIVPLSQLRNLDPEGFLGPGVGEVVGANPGFDVSEREAEGVGGPGAGEGGRGIALDDDGGGMAKLDGEFQGQVESPDVVDGVVTGRWPVPCVEIG